MSDITDFNDESHRVESASVTFQKGLYHLFMLTHQAETDAFDNILRMYQCLFELCRTQLLLDFDFRFDWIPPRLRRLCRNPNQPTRKEIDPSALVTHSVFENKEWKGFDISHPLHLVTKHTLRLYEQVVDARHNLVYRPFLRHPHFWEDCTLIALLEHAPTTDEVEQTYQDFFRAIVDWHGLFVQSMPLVLTLKELESESSPPVKRYAGYFLDSLFTVYRDVRGNRPTETLLLTYARMLNPNNEQLLNIIREYRNQLLDVTNLVRILDNAFPKEWRVGEV